MKQSFFKYVRFFCGWFVASVGMGMTQVGVGICLVGDWICRKGAKFALGEKGKELL